MGDRPTEQPWRRYGFGGGFVLAPEQQSLTRDDVPVRIGGRALDILTALVERPGEVVSKRDLMARAWSDVTVEENNLKVNIAALRKCLGDDPDAARYIATVPGRGYRFIAPVDVFGDKGMAAPSVLPVQNHNLPYSTTRIFGRSATIETIRGDLAGGRLVSIVGPGGIGKTTVALAVAEQLTSTYPDGVWLVDLSALAEPALVPTAIATTVGMTADSPNILATLCAFLRGRRLLIVLDSCEHLLEHVATCADAILASAPQVQILATSREQLRARGERVHRLTGLDIPAATQDDSALAFPAIQLFVDRAKDALEGFSLSDAEAPMVAEICRRLDGHALAIELAAARVGTFGVHGILQHIESVLGFTQSQRSGAERHRTLTATIAWSFGLLTATERTVLGRLASFAGSFTLDAARAVAADDTLVKSGVLEALASLVDKSLVSAEIRGRDVDYRLLDTTRAYALGKLTDSGAFDSVRHRHARHFLAVARQAADEDERLTQAQWVAGFASQLDDLRLALRWAYSHPDFAQLAIDLTIAAIPFWRRLSLAEECRVATERALQPNLATARRPDQEMILQQTLGAVLLDIQGTVPEVKLALQAALHLATSLNAVDRQIDCLRGLSKYELLTGDSQAALVLADRLRAIVGDDNPAASASADAGAGTAFEWLGQLTSAREYLDKAIRHNQSNGRAARFEFNQYLISLASTTQVLWLQGFGDQAQATANRMLAEAEASHYAWSYCYALFQSSQHALHVRNYEAAKRHMDAGVDHATRHGLSFWRSTVVAGQLCRWKLYLAQWVDLDELRVILAAVQERGFRMYYPHLLTNFGEALARQGDVLGGLAAIDRALDLCEQTGQIVAIPEILRIKGNVIAWQLPASWQQASECYRRSIELARRNGAPAWEIRSASSLVKLGRAHGGDAEAETMLAAAYDKFSEGHGTGDLMRAKALLGLR